jgi:predicted kinase
VGDVAMILAPYVAVYTTSQHDVSRPILEFFGYTYFMNRAKLIVMSGIPGTGKSTLVDYLGKELSLAIVTKDEIEATLKRNISDTDLNTGWVAYNLLTTIADEQLRRNVSIVIDSVAGSTGMRETWRKLADRYDVEFVVVECICSDANLHLQRLEARKRNIKDWPELTWQDVLEVQARYQPWDIERLVLDSVDDFETNAAKLRKYLEV